MAKKKFAVLTGAEYDWQVPKIVPLEVQDPIVTLAISMIERWGMIAGVEAGEDSAGRAKIRLATPEELVERAFTTATLVDAEARKRGLIYAAPEPVLREDRRDTTVERALAYIEARRES